MNENFEDSAFRKDERLENLESNYDELSDKVEKLELSGFQEQINIINSNITEIKDSILKTNRQVARIFIDNYRYNIYLTAREILKNNQSIYNDFIDYLEIQTASARAEIKLSQTPLAVSNELDAKIRKYCKRHNIDIFVEE